MRFLVHEHVRSLAQAALKFVLSHDAVSVVIPGAKIPQQVEENVSASQGACLPQKDLDKVAALWKTDLGL